MRRLNEAFEYGCIKEISDLGNAFHEFSGPDPKFIKQWLLDQDQDGILDKLEESDDSVDDQNIDSSNGSGNTLSRSGSSGGV